GEVREQKKPLEQMRALFFGYRFDSMEDILDTFKYIPDKRIMAKNIHRRGTYFSLRAFAISAVFQTIQKIIKSLFFTGCRFYVPAIINKKPCHPSTKAQPC
ncbi:MAG: hypothetical protein ACT6FC_00135, partial [Methanosarcinaceae archaeon]